MTITQKKLEEMLWGAAVLLRGQIESSDYKQYIFPLLFFKRMNDVFHEEYIEAFELYEDEELAPWMETEDNTQSAKTITA